MNKVALIMCPYTYSYSIPYQLGYLKSSLEKAGIESRVYDVSIDLYCQREAFEIEEYDELEIWQIEESFKKKLLPQLDSFIDRSVEAVLSGDPQIIAFSLFNTNRIFAQEMAKRFKRINPKLKIVFGGVDCTISFNSNSYSFYRRLIEKGAVDAVLIGEGDYIFPRYCLGEHLQGVITKKTLKSQTFSMYPFIERLDEIPFPDYRDLDLKLYSGDVLPLSFSRGCNYHCTFCEIETLWCDSLRTRGAKSLFAEIIFLDANTDKNFLFFNGAYVNSDGSLINDLTDMIISKWGDSPRFKWNGWAKIHRNLSKVTLHKMKKAGCYELVFGLESGSQKVINDMKKGFLISDAEIILRDVHSAGIDVTVFIIVGYPTESEEDFQLTLDFLSRNSEFIRAAYCMSECILSDKMLADPEKYGVRKEKLMDAFGWTSLGGMTYSERKKRRKRFRQHLSKIGIESS